MLHVSHGVTFVVWSPNEEIHVERIYYNQCFIMQAIAKARIFYFDVFLPSIVPCVLIHTSSSHNGNANSFHVIKNVEVHEENVTSIHAETPPSIQNHDNKHCTIVCASEANKLSPLPSVLQKLHFRRHTVNGDGNCSYHAIAHQAGFIGHDCHGDTLVAQQLRMLALNYMQQYPAVRVEDGISVLQWEKKKI